MATIRLGDQAPNFKAKSSEGTINFHEWLGDSWGILFSHPADYTPVCTTELGTVANQFTVRSVFVIAPDKTVKLIITYPASTGRNFDELLRVIDSLQLTAYYKVATPANWKHGEDVVISPSISTEDAKGIFKKGVNEIKPYLRMTPQPNLN
ncbi:UNVERIFIED_CONTAM: hypothetical protein GTU68_049260 [Idotea baltica]|nr:hypothetical protein [Idotea baltica]